MVKKFSVSISDQVYDQYLGHIKKNRSRHIENLIVEGSNALMMDNNNTRTKLIQSQELLRNYEDKIRKLNFEIDKRKTDRTDAKAEREKRIARHKGIVASGVLK